MSRQPRGLHYLEFLAAFIFCIIILFPVRVHAEINESNVYYLDKDGGTFFISVLFEKGDLKLSLKDPDDMEVSLNSPNVEYVQSDSTVFIIVKNAKRGQWKLIYDKGSNEELQVAAYADEEPMVIDSLKIGSMDADGNVPVSFKVTQPDGRSFSYEIRIGTDEDMMDYRVLTTGYGYEGEITETEISLKDINTFDQYYLQIVAYYDKDYMRYMGSVTSERFSFVNPSEEPDAIEDYRVTVDVITKTIEVDISEYAPWEAKSYMINIREDGAEADPLMLIRSEDGDIGRFQYKEGTKEIECSVVLQNDSGRISKPLTKTVYLTERSGKFWMNLPESDTINSTDYSFSYVNALEQTVYTRIDDQREEEFTLNGDGNHLISVGANSCELRIRYQADDNIWYEYNILVSVDVIPPELKIYEALNGIVTDEKKIVLTGKTEADAALKVNDAETDKNEDGSFSIELDLADDDNSFNITATDAAGNTSAYAFSIIYSKNGEAPSDVDADLDDITDGSGGSKPGTFGKWLWLIALLFVAVMIITTALVVFIGIKKRDMKQNMFRGAVVVVGFSVAGFILNLVYYIIRRNYQNSEKYIDLSANNIHEAYSYLSVTRFSGILLILLVIIMILSAGVILFVKLSGKKLKTPEFVKKATGQVAEIRKQNSEPWNAYQTDGPQNNEESGDWKICKHCGARNRAQAKFCIKCGQPNE